MDDTRPTYWIDRCQFWVNKARNWQRFTLVLLFASIGGALISVTGSGVFAYIGFSLNAILVVYWIREYFSWVHEEEHWEGRLEYWKFEDIRDRYH